MKQVQILLEMLLDVATNQEPEDPFEGKLPC